MRILVTGGAGFVGRHACSEFLAGGHGVVSVDRLGRHPDPRVVSFEGTVSDFMHDINLWRVIPNLMNIIDRPAPGFDAIIHLAAIPRYGISIERPAEVLSNNYISTLNVLEYCRRHPFTRLVYVSSAAATFDDVTENPCALSKLQGEQLVSLYRKTFGTMATTVRLFSVYGPGETDYGQYSSLFRRCQNCILTGADFELAGDGSQVRDFTHVSDVARGLVAVFNELMDSSVSQPCLPVYELGASNAKYCVKDIIAAFAKGTSLKVKRRPRRASEPHLTMADPQLRPQGWEPTIDPLQYIEDWKWSLSEGREH